MRNKNNDPIQYNDSFTDGYDLTPEDPISGHPTAKKRNQTTNRKNGTAQQKKNNPETY